MNLHYTDLAIEKTDYLKSKIWHGIAGLVRTEMILPSGDRATTLFGEGFSSQSEVRDAVRDAIAHTLKTYAPNARQVLFVGLGNVDFSCDAVGVLTAESLFPTTETESRRRLSVIVPGVSGRTGIDTADTVRALVDRMNPDLVLVCDALSARDPAHIGTTFQISTAGIAPASGVGEDSIALRSDTLGCDTLSIGFPTAVRAGVLAADILDTVKNIKAMSEGAREQLAEEISRSPLSALVVAPKCIDRLVRLAARVIADGIGLYVENSITVDF